MPHDLQVPFREKDQAKALGARFDFNRKVWFVPDGVDLVPFSKWLPAGFSVQEPAELLPATSLGAALVGTPGESLSGLLQRVSALVAGEFRAPVWVRAELGDLKLWGDGNHKRAYLELIETAADGRQLARCRAVIWEQQLPGLARKFREATQSELGPGLKVLLQASVEFDGRNGLSLVVRDIDPAFTLGDVAARLAQIREYLKKQRLFDLNRRYRLPDEYCRIAVITPRDAAGLGDFRRDIHTLEAHGVLQVQYFEAVFQGPNTATSLMSAMTQALSAHERAPFDVLIVLRGGGAVTDLAWLNDQNIAEMICRAPLPVLTGIGHERDQTILDEVAARAFDTPSKISQFIRQTIVNNVAEARANLRTILALAQQHGALARANMQRQEACLRAESARHYREGRNSIERLHGVVLPAAREQAQQVRRGLGDAMVKLERSARSAVHHRAAELHGLLHAVHSQAARVPHLAREQIDNARNQIADLAARQTHLARTHVQALGREVAGLGPRPTLERGFALVKNAQGAVVRSKDAVAPGERISIQFNDGSISAEVKTDE